MKKFHSRLLMALAITIAITLCGCSDPGMGEEEATVHVAIVAANTANANTLAVNLASVKDTLRESAYTHGHVSMVRCDGSPQVVFSTEIPTPKAKINQAKKDQLADEYTSQLQQIMGNGDLTAVHDEIDTLEAIRLATYQLHNAPEGRRIMLIMNSGLSTTSYLNYAAAPSLLKTAPEAVVSALQAAQAIPDATGLEVIWMGIGETATPQPQLSAAEITALKDTWKAILTSAGANSITFMEGITTGTPNPAESLPHVSVVETEGRTIHVFPTVTLDQSTVSFNGNQASFQYPEAAQRAIAEAAQVIQGSNGNVIILGCTAGGENGTPQLAYSRASAVADELINLGIDPSRLEVIGLPAQDNPFYLSDLDEHGKQIRDIAGQNRWVKIIDANSADAALLK